MAELKDIHTFFRLEDKKYICLLADCKSKISTLKNSSLFRHFQCCHPSKLKELKPLNKSLSNLEIIREEVLLICVEHVTVCGRTLTSIEDSSFQKLLEFRLKTLRGTPQQLTITSILILAMEQLHPLIHKTAEEVREKIRLEFANKYFSVMFDTMTKRNRAVLGIDVRTIHEGKLITRSIGMQRITVQHTGKNIANMIIERLKDHGISPELLVSATIDNGSNVAKAVKIMDSLIKGSLNDNESKSGSDDENGSDSDSIANFWLDPDFQRDLIEQATREICSVSKPYVYEIVECIRCAAHTIQFAVNEALEKTNCVPVIEKARKLVKNLRLQQILLKLEEQGLPVPPVDVVTRWFSLYIMVRIGNF